MNDNFVKQIDSLINQTWRNSRNSYYKMKGIDEPVETEDGNEPEELEVKESESVKGVVEEEEEEEFEIPIQLGERFENLLKNHPQGNELQDELKDELMRWFWMGYYQGVNTKK